VILTLPLVVVLAVAYGLHRAGYGRHAARFVAARPIDGLYRTNATWTRPATRSCTAPAGRPGGRTCPGGSAPRSDSRESRARTGPGPAGRGVAGLHPAAGGGPSLKS